MVILCLFVATINILLAMGDKIEHDSIGTHFGTIVFTIVMPLFLVAVFEMAYNVHKARSVKFCGIVFDQGHRIDTEPCSWFLRNIVRILALAIFVLGILIDFSLIGLEGENAGTSGFSDAGGAGSQYILSLIPATVMAFICIYLSIYMWRYGSNASMVVHSTWLNKWLALFVGSVVMFAGQFPPEPVFRFTSAFGLTVLLAAMLLVYGEIEKEEKLRAHFAQFLEVEDGPSREEKSSKDMNSGVHPIDTAPVTRASILTPAENTTLFEGNKWIGSGAIGSAFVRAGARMRNPSPSSLEDFAKSHADDKNFHKKNSRGSLEL
eukprot:CAMPEP_0171451748 /NCGR_PEP_ID=MMETSP0945-20130129/123_1 /TAXON_ID=109269 /ORGANISM="Vaucheria litorea, Strain CCMP2940" /LENGTH=320 /DNA_ID=CAMNT_0011976259 /DNA_START=276 /DNA_END=1238 /DNA_ORIENTATION=-